ncbi:MAG: sigma-70 family RNA polymerase sigma factor [Planctomycetaceae bacterium]|nr:sigma-70 family RNA polymerase sigma factor [Planctomycetales bacterium]MCB9874097.1 sigma-70 family RNA polymerase sigma factor [Planctomycetaceae bacterium]MCB9940550.1 sigma-70 family RNA polymerase sigma factor [Planctomycetaceae bacterium]
MHPPIETNPDSLLVAAQAGTSGCLSRLLQLYSNYLRLLACSQLDERLRARVSPSDIVQETLFEAHRDFDRFVGRSSGEFVGWLRTILVHNLARMVEHHLLTGKRDVRRDVSLDEIGVGGDQSKACLAALLHDDITSPSSQVERHEQVVALAEALTLLPPDYRQVIVLRHVDGRRFKEIAEVLGRSEGATRMLWLRAVEELREQLDLKGLL